MGRVGRNAHRRRIVYSARSPQPAALAPDNRPVRYHHLGPGHGVFEIDYRASNEVGKGEAAARGELELLVWYGGGEPTRAAWVWSQSGAIAGWAVVGEA